MDNFALHYHVTPETGRVQTHLIVRAMQQDVVCERGLNTIIVYYLECISPLGMADRTIEDSQITTSSVLRTTYGWQARLGQNIPPWGAWCPDTSGGSKTKRNYDQYIQIDLLKLTKITGIATQGREYNGGTEYVKDYRISYCNDSLNWIFYREKEQPANETKVDMIKDDFDILIEEQGHYKNNYSEIKIYGNSVKSGYPAFI